jgi:hypothetical protein
MKSQVDQFMAKINGISKVCVGDLYTNPDEKKNAIVFCFNSKDDLTNFEKLFDFVNEKDLANSQGVFDSETDQSFDVHFSDGHDILIQKKIEFKVDGMYENKKLLMKYDVLDTFDNKKCNIAQNLPIVPIKFLEVGLFNNKCVAKFRYNKIDSYIGSSDKNCVNIMKYIVQKISTNCQKAKNGPMNKYTDELISRPMDGKWTGWVKYHKLMDNGGTLDPNSFKVSIKPEIIEIYDNTTSLRQTIDYKNITWSCNDDSDCSIQDFVIYLKNSKQNTKLGDFQKIVNQLIEKWSLQDFNHCFVIEENDIHIICPIDYSEEYSAKLALALSMDKKLIDADANTFIPYKNGTEFSVIYSTDSNIYFEDYDIKVLPNGVMDQNGNKLIDYNKIKELKNVKCGFEYRLMSLPGQFHEISPYCCARFFTDENNWICMQQQAKCYVPLRHMIQLIRTNCLFAHGLTGLTNPTAANPLKPELMQNNTRRAWSGEVIFQEIDNYKYKGEVNIQKGYFSLDPNNATYTVNNEKVFSLALETLNFQCDTAMPCLPAQYVAHQNPFLEKGYDREWQQATLAKFWEANRNIDQNDCMVLVSEDTYWEISTMILTCATSAGQGLSMRTSVIDVYNKKIEKLNGNETEVTNIPPAADNKEFNCLVISTTNSTNVHTVQAANTILKVALDGLTYKASGDYLFKYKDLIDTNSSQVLYKFDLDEKKEIPLSMQKKKVNAKCCFKNWSLAGSVFYICLTSGDKCYNEKATLFKTVKSRGERAMGILAAELKRRALALETQVEDPFEYGLGPEYKKFSSKFNLDSLSEDTYDNSKNGFWSGWVYESALTDRNYNKKVSPVFMEVKRGIIQFKTDDDSPAPYKTLKLYEYNQLCSEHCMPKDYILKKVATIDDYDDMMFLKKSVMNILGQIKNPYVEEGCVLMDFTSPIYQFGHSDIICAVDKLQGDKIRTAIESSYYEALLDMDIDKEVRRPSLQSDGYFVKIIINDEYKDDFNHIYLDDKGLVGRKMPNDPKITTPLSKDTFRIKYSQVAADNYGTTCAFWYKNLKIRQRSAELTKQVTDNNCCFKFYTKGDKKKIEICAHNLDGRICIKQARELMKGLKLGCSTTAKFSVDTGSMNPDQRDQSIDIYHAKTIDDSQNGAFDGFVYFGIATASSQSPRSNPFYMRMHRMSIEFYSEHTKINSPILSINVENLRFSCAGKTPCTPENYLNFAKNDPKLMNQAMQIQTVYHMFKDNYGLSKNFDQICFVIETVTVPFLVCPYVPETATSMKKALVQAYMLNHFSKRLSSVPDSDPSETYTIIMQTDKEQPHEDEIVVNSRAVMSIKSNLMVLDYRRLDNDPIIKKRCAVWFKEIPLKFKFENPECCFAVSVQGKISNICVKSNKVCVGSAFRLMKSIWNGCMYNAPSQSVMKPSPDSETLGETEYKTKIFFDAAKVKYSICQKERQSPLFEEKKLSNDYNVDLYNDVAYSMSKTIYKGWFNVYPIDLTSESSWSLLKYYGEISPESFKFYDSPEDKKSSKLIVRPDLLSMACGKGYACKPMEFIDYVSKQNATLSYLKSTIQSKLDFYEIKKEDGCAVLENIVANIPNYFIICAHIKMTRSHEKSLQDQIDHPMPYTKSRSLLSAHFGEIIRKVVYDSYITSRKYLDGSDLPVGDEIVKQARITILNTRNEYLKVSINDQGVVSNSAMVIKFDDLQHCRVKMNLVFAPEEILYDNKPNCCMRFMGPANHEYICVKDLNCEYSVLRFARRFNEKCAARKNRKDDDVWNEMGSGYNVFAMKAIKRIFKAEIKFSDIHALNTNTELSTDEFKVKHKTLTIKYLFKIKEMMHKVNLLDIKKSQKMVKTPIDTTPADPPLPTVSGIVPKYIGENDEMRVVAARNKVTQYAFKSNGDVVTIIRDFQFIKTKDFSAIIGEKTDYIVLYYNDDGDKVVQVEKDEVMVTNTGASLSNEFKIFEGLIGASGISIPGASISTPVQQVVPTPVASPAPAPGTPVQVNQAQARRKY